MLTRRFRDVGNFATSSSSRLLLAIYLLCWLPSMLEAFSDKVPIVTIANASQEILVVRNSNETLQFTCNGNNGTYSNLTWVQGDDDALELSEDEPGISLSVDSLTLVLTINVSEADGDRLASREGVPYYCLARNNLGTARSQAVTLRYPSFDGFNQTMQNETVEVRIDQDQAVALHCGYVGTPVPKPEVTWLKDQVPIPIDDEAVSPHYRVLEDGELVIYDVVTSDVTNGNGQPVQYLCRVDNVLLVETRTAPFFYTLYSNENNTLSEDPTIYLNPPAAIFLTKNEPAFIYFVYASNGGVTEMVATQFPSLGETQEDEPNLRVALNNGVTQNSTITIRADYVVPGVGLTSYDPFVQRTTAVTLIEPLVIDASTTMNQVFRGFTNETTFNFICNASGSQLALVWYKDGEQISAGGSSLTIPHAGPNDSGVYQCFWTSELRPSQIFDSVSWALVVRDRVPPNMISSTTSVSPDNDEPVIVVEGTTVTISVTVRSDVMPEVSWNFTNLNGITTLPLNTSNMTLYETTSINFIEEELYQFTLTLVNMTVENSGWFSPVIDDGFTTPSVGPTQFISIEFPADVVSVDSSHNCLLAGEVVSITCEVEGLPKPTVSFLKNSEAFQLGDCQSCSVVGNVLTFSMVTSADQGTYGCNAQNTNNGSQRIDTESLNDGMAFMYCDHPEVSVVGSSNLMADVGEDVTLTCQVTSVPPPVVTWMFNGTNVDTSSDSYTTTQATNGDYSLIINKVNISNTGTYTCQVNNTAIPEVVVQDINLTVNSTVPLAVYWYAVIGVGGVLFIAVLISLVLLCCCCYSSRKSGSYSASGARSMLAKDEYDGRGNVDRDSDDENGKGEEPEAFQPQYESLPALRPAAPPQYKPSPAYGGQADMEMVKMPIPDTESTAFEFTPGPPPFQGYRPGNGSVLEDGHGGSTVGLQARFEDFMSDDGQFV